MTFSFVKKNWRIKRSQIRRHTLQINTRHLAVNILFVMQGRKQLNNFRTVEKNQERNQGFNNWIQSSSNVNIAIFIVIQQIAKRGNSYTDGEYIRSCFINAFEELFTR